MPRTTRTSKARTAALTTDDPTRPLPVVTVRPEPVRKSIDDLAAECRPMVFRLLDAGRPAAAAELLETYRADADRALWSDIVGPSTGALSLVTAVSR